MGFWGQTNTLRHLFARLLRSRNVVRMLLPRSTSLIDRRQSARKDRNARPWNGPRSWPVDLVLEYQRVEIIS